MLKYYKESLHDAERVIELKPEWSKGYLRAGQAYEQLLDYNLARDYYERGLQKEPEDPNLKCALDNLHGILAELKLTESQLSANPNPEADRFQHMIDWLKQGGNLRFLSFFLSFLLLLSSLLLLIL